MSLYIGLQHLIDQNVISDETTLRYITGHPISRVTVAMFLVGTTALLLIGKNVFEQFRAERQIALDELPEIEDGNGTHHGHRDQVDLAIDYGDQMLRLPKWMQQHYLWQRIVHALHYVYRSGSAAGVEDELKHLAENDLDHQQQRYSLVGILIWATPMLGFIGTVLGISQALGGIAVGPENDFQQMMNGLRGSLYIAFDTTALALTLSMVMMFTQFLVQRFESQLLELVDQRARSEIERNFDLTAIAATGNSGGDMVAAVRALSQEQTDLWRSSIESAQQAWTATLTQTSDVVRDGLSVSIEENVAALAHYLGEAIERADLSMSHRWEQWQVTLSENARMMEKHQIHLARQANMLESMVDNVENGATFKRALQQQQIAIDATTKTHDVLIKLSKTVAAGQGGNRVPGEMVSDPEAQVTSAQKTSRAFQPAIYSPGATPVMFAPGKLPTGNTRRVLGQIDAGRAADVGVVLPASEEVTTRRQRRHSSVG